MTHDVQEVLQIVDYVYFVSDGQIVAQGTPDEIRASADPFVHQFVFGEADGPVHFHYPAPPFEAGHPGRAPAPARALMLARNAATREAIRQRLEGRGAATP